MKALFGFGGFPVEELCPVSEGLAVVVGAEAGMASAAPASIGVGPRITREVVKRGNCGRLHSGMVSAAWVLAVFLSGEEVVPLEDIEVGWRARESSHWSARSSVFKPGGWFPFIGVDAEELAERVQNEGFRFVIDVQVIFGRDVMCSADFCATAVLSTRFRLSGGGGGGGRSCSRARRGQWGIPNSTRFSSGLLRTFQGLAERLLDLFLLDEVLDVLGLVTSASVQQAIWVLPPVSTVEARSF